MLRPALLILSGNSVSALILLVRNITVARFISVEDYGIAVTFAIVMAVIEMISQFGLQQQIVQAKDGNNPRFQASLQGFYLFRGIALGTILFFLAPPLAIFFDVPQIYWAYQVLAVVPVMNALTHFDVHRLTRKMVFWPLMLTGAVPALISFLAILPLSLFFDDYRVMLYSIVLQAAMTALTSHVVACRRYRIAFDPKIMASNLRFGWPLILNSGLLFVVFNGDKLLIGRVLGMDQLAIFAMGVTLTLTPTLVIAKSAQSFFLPQLSKIDRSTTDGSELFQRLAIVTLQSSVLSGVFLVLAILFFGEIFVLGALGQNYASLVPLLVPMGVMHALQTAKTGCSVTAIASGHTANSIYGNVIRFASMPLVWFLLVKGEGLMIIIMIATASEALGYCISLFLLFNRPGINLKPMIGTLVSFFTFGAFIVFTEERSGIIFLCIVSSLVTVLIWFTQDFRFYLIKHFRSM